MLHGRSGFTATEATYDRFVSLPASMLGFYDYVSAHCLLPQYHDDLRTCLGLFRGVTASQWPAMKFVLPFVVLTAGFAGVSLIGSGRSVTSTPRAGSTCRCADLRRRQRSADSAG